MADELARIDRDVDVYRDSAPIADDTLIAVAKMAEARIDAVNKIKQIALKVTNARDWCDQQGNPYLQVSGAEKIANLFNVSWSFLTAEPLCETEPDSHYTYTFKGRFSMGGRSIEAEGSRSSKDSFFKQNEWKDGVKTEKTVDERDNKRDVKMAAYTNLLGNGITRLLGIRNLTWDDLEKFAGIKRDQVGKVEYKKEGKPINPPQEKAANGDKKSEGQQPLPGAGADAEPIITQAQGKMLFAKFKGKGVDSGALMNTAVRGWYQDDNLELFKLPAKHLEDCIKRIDALPEPGK